MVEKEASPNVQKQSESNDEDTEYYSDSLDDNDPESENLIRWGTITEFLKI